MAGEVKPVRTIRDFYEKELICSVVANWAL